MKNKNRIIKIVLVIAMLIPVLSPPYWYYQLLRLFGTIGFGYLAYSEYKSSIKYLPVMFGVFAVLLNPVFTISFGRDIWLIVDIAIAILTTISIFIENKLASQKKLPD